MFTQSPSGPEPTASTATNFRLGDIVRVRGARRRDVVFTIVELTPTDVRATNDRGGEALYPPASFEHAAPSVSAPTSDTSSPSRPVKAAPPTFEPLCDGRSIRPHPGEAIDLALKRFKKAVDKSGVLREHRERLRFVPASQRRRTKAADTEPRCAIHCRRRLRG